MENVFIKYNHGFSWYEQNTILTIGYAFHQEKYMSAKDISQFVNDNHPSDFNTFQELVSKLSGSFSIIIKTENSYFLYSDISRFFPVFYSVRQGVCRVSDSPEILSDRNISTKGLKQILKFGYTLFDNTIWQSVKQVEPGFAIALSNSGIDKKMIFRYDVIRYDKVSKRKVKEIISKELISVGKKYTASLNNRQVILPLSGGLDSRYIAAFLKQNNYTNVICFTYADEYNREVQKSESVAQALGFDWHFIKNTDALPIAIDDPNFKDYYNFGARGVSFFHMHEYFAINQLKEMNLVNDNAIVLSGYAGDLIAGSQIIKSALPWSSKATIQRAIFGLNFQGINKSAYTFLDFKKDHSVFFNSFPVKSKAISIFEHWFIQEKVSKGIFNAGFLYSFFGFEVRFPFWDANLMDAFRKIPIRYRVNESMYYKVLKEVFFEPYNIVFEDDLQGILIKNIKQAIKLKVNKFIRPSMCDLSNNKLIKPLIKQMKDENLIFTNNINSEDGMYLQWYLHQEIKKATNEKEALTILESFIEKN